MKLQLIILKIVIIKVERKKIYYKKLIGISSILNKSYNIDKDSTEDIIIKLEMKMTTTIFCMIMVIISHQMNYI